MTKSTLSSHLACPSINFCLSVCLSHRSESVVFRCMSLILCFFIFSPVDDIAFARDIVSFASLKWRIDTDRIFVSGMSNGKIGEKKREKRDREEEATRERRVFAPARRMQ